MTSFRSRKQLFMSHPLNISIEIFEREKHEWGAHICFSKKIIRQFVSIGGLGAQKSA